MTTAINQSPTAANQTLALLNNLQAEIQAQATSPAAPASKGKLLSKDAPTINPITPITPPPAGNDTVNLIAIIAAMMAAVQAMELCISHLMSTATSCESTMSIDAAKASEESQEKNIQKTQDAEEKAKEAAKRSGIMKIFGYIAAALTCVVSFGTLSVVAALMIAAIVVLDTLGLLQKGIDACLTGMGVDPDSVLGKILSVVIKIAIIIIATKGTGAAEEAASSGAEAGTSTASSTATETSEIEMQSMGDAAEEAEEAGADSAEDSSTTEKAAPGNKALAQRIQFAGMFGSLNPLGDLCVVFERAILGHKDKDAEAWIQMATAIVSALIGMAAMFSAPEAAGKGLSDPVVMGKITNATMKLSVLINLVASGLGIDVGVLKIQQGQIEKELGPLKAISDELKALVEMLQSISQDQQQWMKQNNATDKELSDSFNYDEFANFAQVQLHG